MPIADGTHHVQGGEGKGWQPCSSSLGTRSPARRLIFFGVQVRGLDPTDGQMRLSANEYAKYGISIRTANARYSADEVDWGGWRP